jgi:hypothetical protein
VGDQCAISFRVDLIDIYFGSLTHIMNSEKKHFIIKCVKKFVKSENGNDIVTDNQEIARQFNDFFIDSVLEINESCRYCVLL